MKKILILFTLVFFLFFLGCSSEHKNKKIVGKWKTIHNQNNSQIIFYISDSTILTEFWFDEGIKKIQYSYKIAEETDSSLIIQTKNYFNIFTMDTISFDSSKISYSTQDGTKLNLFKLE
jgi:hypothetical protein